MSSTKPLVLLTGINGFVGAHVLSALLISKYRVRGVVRSLAKSTYLVSQHPIATREGDLAFIEVPDIQAGHALDAAVEEVQYICHVASPYFTSTTNPIADLVEPAVNGTKNVLESALRQKSKTLKRMTILSSFASVVDLSKNPRPGYTYTADDWDPVTMKEAAKDGFMGYHASKTLAERTAWDLYRPAKSKGEITWDLVTFCPPMIYGPPIQGVDVRKGIDGLNTSVKRLITSVQGKDPAFAPRVATPGLPAWVDVRDVAEAHVRALMLPAGVSERFLLCGGVEYFEDGLVGLRATGEKGLGREGAKVDRTKHFSIDRSKAEETLGLEFRAFQVTVEDTWQRVKELGFGL
jgi:nucleoside-diphosphate-sugar epimerase